MAVSTIIYLAAAYLSTGGTAGGDGPYAPLPTTGGDSSLTDKRDVPEIAQQLGAIDRHHFVTEAFNVSTFLLMHVPGSSLCVNTYTKV